MFLPKVSLIIVVRDEKDYIISAIDSLLQQSYPQEKIEIIIVDGMSTDGTREIILNKNRELASSSHSLTILDNNKKILSSGWNIGILHAKGEIVCRIDAHATISKDYILQGVQELICGNRNNVAAVGGWITHFGLTDFSKVIAKLFCSKFVVGNSPFRRKPLMPVISDTAVYGLYWKNIFDDVGYFDENLVRNQDIDLHLRIQAAGYCFITHPALEINYYIRSSMGKLLKKAFSDGYWAIRSGKYLPRHTVPLLFVLYLIMLLLLWTIRNVVSLNFALFWVAVVPAALYIVLALIFALYHQNIFMLILAPMYHICYGFGSMAAYFRKYFICKKR